MSEHVTTATQVVGKGSILRFADLDIVFPGRKAKPVTAVRGFTLDVRKGEILSLVGPSGCGKSSVLRAGVGLLAPGAGQVSFAPGCDFSHVALVFQKALLLPWLTVLENVLYPCRVGGRRIHSTDRDRARALLDMVGLGRWINAMPSALSGGMQQRAAICRGLILDPSILFMDESFGALDALTREELQLDLLRLQERTGKAIVLVTHSMTEAVLLSHRIAVMTGQPGRLHDVFAVGLPWPRGIETSAEPAFMDYVRRVRAGIYHRAGSGDTACPPA